MRVAFSILFLALSLHAGAPPCDPLTSEIADPTQDLDSVFLFLAQFPSARPVVEKIQRKLRDGDVVIVPVTEAKAGQTRLRKPASLFDFPEGRATIYLGGGELGLVAPLLLHESIHALDVVYAERFVAWKPESLRLADEFEDLVRGTMAWQEWQKSAKAIERRRHRMVFQAERPAFDGQQALIDEIMETHTCAKAYYSHHDQAEHLVTRKVDDKELMRLYRLKSEWALKD